MHRIVPVSSRPHSSLCDQMSFINALELKQKQWLETLQYDPATALAKGKAGSPITTELWNVSVQNIGKEKTDIPYCPENWLPREASAVEMSFRDVRAMLDGKMKEK
ncbi:hypothetical protein JD844_026114 [Phrynosoma platyrhinos]|uniref:Uncharacterized protein n=1 Tax=Phrynosoma platyrhinos TaxID=52577 RepID=A0ABQ7SEH6_PHRPL|nr:hypothetical protein JD844_026114 [Phrynosoma platyrhinos]